MGAEGSRSADRSRRVRAPGRHPAGPAATCLLAVLLAVLLAGTGCTGQAGPPAAPRAGTGATGPHVLPPAEGTVRLLSQPGHVERGATDPRVDWVSDFQRETGCQVRVTYAEQPEELVAKFTADGGDGYDAVSAGPVAAGRLIEAGAVRPLDVDLVPGYGDLAPRLRSARAFRVGDQRYGLPFVWDATLLAYTGQAGPPRDGWAAVFAQRRSRVVLRDSPLTIADVALHLRKRRPGLRIGDPYELTPEQLDAVIELLDRQRRATARYWTSPVEVIDALASGEASFGQATPHVVDGLRQAGHPVSAVLPAEGATASLDGWMVSARARHPGCAYRWLAWTITPRVQRQVAEWIRAAPANPRGCGLLGARFCAAYHVTDRALQDRLTFARLPVARCAGEPDRCTDYAEWTRRWAAIAG